MKITIECECGEKRTIDTEKPMLNTDNDKIDVWMGYDPRLSVSCKCGKCYSI